MIVVACRAEISKFSFLNVPFKIIFKAQYLNVKISSTTQPTPR